MSTLALPSLSARRPARRPMLPILRAANAAVCVADSDRPQGSLMVGGQGSGKTSAELRMYLNDIRDANAAVVVFDPKSELSHLALKLTPPDCGKRVWFLDLGRPAFGMTPLRMYGDQSFASEAAAIADGIVESLLDINEGQIMQASRDLLYRSVIGALAIAQLAERPPTFEDIYSLLLPGREDAREAAFNACARIDDLDQTAEFFRKELPDDLKLSQSSTADRLRAPRNKVAGVVGVPPLRRFLNHPTDLALRTIVENRDILIVDANMAAIGEANAQAIMHFVFRQLHRQMQRQVRFPQDERPRVALICDEFHYLASRNVIKQVATHRAAGLDVTAGLQFFSQLGAGAESASITEEIRKGVINLLQSRFLFRLGDPDDAEQATRIAMSVYQSMIRSDPDSRAQMRVTPEAILNLPRFHCLASWIVHGQRAGSFVGQTYPMPHDASDSWAQMHLAAQDARVGEYPEKMAGTLRRKLVATELAEPDHAAGVDTTDPAGPPANRHSAIRPSTAPTAREIDPTATTLRTLPPRTRRLRRRRTRRRRRQPTPRPPRRLSPARQQSTRCSPSTTPRAAPTSTKPKRPPRRITAPCARWSATRRAAKAHYSRSHARTANSPTRCASSRSSTASTRSAKPPWSLRTRRRSGASTSRTSRSSSSLTATASPCPSSSPAP